jgi:hypothetical protein
VLATVVIWLATTSVAAADAGIARVVAANGTTQAEATLVGAFHYPADGSLVTVTAAHPISAGVLLDGVSLLAGRIRMQQASTAAAGSISGLVVDGLPMRASANLVVPLAGTGWAVVDQRAVIPERDGAQRATMITVRLHLTTSWGGEQPGTEILVGYAVSDQPPASSAAGPLPGWLVPIYQQAGARFGVPWSVLAAINRVESSFGADLSVSSAGAVGWMQFLPATWAAYGFDANNDGTANPYDPVDAIFSAARLLAADGAATNLAGAVFAYNHSDMYVTTVLALAHAYQTGSPQPGGVARAALQASVDDARGAFSPVALW